MSEITKFLMDEHHRLKRSFNGYRQDAGNLAEALHVCDLIWIHSTIEEETLCPLLGEIEPDDAADAEADHERFAALMAKIDEMEEGDPALPRIMETLRVVVEEHARHQERVIFPKLSDHPEAGELGAQAFARRQELVNQRPPKSTRRNSLANTGWGGGGSVANAGW